jgi:outer membrane lipoprotein-sorting protein
MIMRLVRSRPSLHFSSLVSAWVKAGLIGLILIAVAESHSYAISIPDLLQKIKENQGEVITLQADMTTEITSTNKNIPPMKQTGKLYQKHPDKSRMEMTEPIKQTTITNGTKMKIVDGASGKSFVQDLSKLKGSSGIGNPQSGMGMQQDPSKALENFNMTITSENDKEIVLVGSPKESNPYLSRMRFTFAPTTFLPTKIEVYGSQNRLLSTTTITYNHISGVYVPIENTSSIQLPQGSMNVRVQYDHVKVNEKVSDALFRVE